MGASVLIFANKTDVGDCMSNEEIIQVRVNFFFPLGRGFFFLLFSEIFPRGLRGRSTKIGLLNQSPADVLTSLSIAWPGPPIRKRQNTRMEHRAMQRCHRGKRA